MKKNSEINFTTSHQLNLTDKPIKFYWQINTASCEFRQLVLPSLHIDLIFVLHGSLKVNGNSIEEAFASPVLTKWKEIEMEPNTTLFGIRYNPTTFFRFSDIKLNELKQSPNLLKYVFSDRRYHDLTSKVFEEEKFEDRVRLLNAYFYNNLQLAKNSDSSIANSFKFIIRNPATKVENIAADTGYSERWIQKKYKQIIGVSPSKVIQINRFNRVLTVLANKSVQSLSEIPYKVGYSDQSHLIRDFKKFSSQTPKTYAKHVPPFIQIMNCL